MSQSSAGLHSAAVESEQTGNIKDGASGPTVQFQSVFSSAAQFGPDLLFAVTVTVLELLAVAHGLLLCSGTSGGTTKSSRRATKWTLW